MRVTASRVVLVWLCVTALIESACGGDQGGTTPEPVLVPVGGGVGATATGGTGLAGTGVVTGGTTATTGGVGGTGLAGMGVVTGGMTATTGGVGGTAATGGTGVAGMGGAGAGGGAAGTFTEVYATMMQTCAGVTCHVGAFLPGAGLSMADKQTAYTNLVGTAARSCAGQMRVAAGDPDASVLVQSLEHSAGCAPAMPRNGTMWSADQLSTVRSWIQAGAMND